MMEVLKFFSLLRSRKSKSIFGVAICLVLLGNIWCINGLYDDWSSGKITNPPILRPPRLLSDLNSLSRQGCLAKLLCGSILEPKQDSPGTSTDNEWGPLDYAQMVKSIFEDFSIKGVAKSLLAIRKSKHANRKAVGQKKVEDNVRTEPEDSASLENNNSAEQTSNEDKSNENSSLEEQLLKDVGNIKRKLSPSKRAGMNEYLHKRIVTIRNPRFDKTLYLDKKHNEFSMTKNDTQKIMIADEVGKRFRSARQCRAFGILDRFANFSLCPFEPAELQQLVYKSSPVTTTTTTESTQFMHKTNKLRHLKDYDEEEDDSPEISYRPSEFNSRSRNGLQKPIYREGEAERILNAMLSYGSITYPQSGTFGQATLGQVGATTEPSYSLQWVQNKYGDDDEDSVETRKKDKKKKGGNTENVRNPNIFHNENHVNIFSVHGYPKVKDKKSKEATEEEDDEHGWENPNSPHLHHYQKRYRYPLPPPGSPEDCSSESESEEESEKETSSEELELELHNKSNIVPPGMSVALSMNPVFSITNSHGSSGQQGPLLKSPSLLPNQPLLPDLDVLPQLPTLPKRTASEDESEATVEESEDAEPENTALTLEDYEY